MGEVGAFSSYGTAEMLAIRPWMGILRSDLGFILF